MGNAQYVWKYIIMWKCLRQSRGRSMDPCQFNWMRCFCNIANSQMWMSHTAGPKSVPCWIISCLNGRYSIGKFRKCEEDGCLQKSQVFQGQVIAVIILKERSGGMRMTGCWRVKGTVLSPHGFNKWRARVFFFFFLVLLLGWFGHLSGRETSLWAI